MPRNFSFLPAPGTMEGPRFWLNAAAITLALLNAAALFLYLDPPGGSRRQLTEQSEQIRAQISASARQTGRLKAVAEKVQLGSGQST
jgi:hypothetical protein